MGRMPILPSLIVPVDAKTKATLLSAGWQVPFVFSYNRDTHETLYMYRGDWT